MKKYFHSFFVACFISALILFFFPKDISILHATITHKQTSPLQTIQQYYPVLFVNEHFEFTRNKNTFRIYFKTYYPISSSNISLYIQNQIPKWIVIIQWKTWYLVDRYEIQKKYSFPELESIFSTVLNKQSPYKQIHDRIVWYYFDEYLTWKDASWVYLSDLKRYNIDPKQSLLIKNNNEYAFVIQYTTWNIVSTRTIEWISNRNAFLQALWNDRKTSSEQEIESTLLMIKSTVNSITQTKTKEEAIRSIYGWIIDSIDYEINFSTKNLEVFSWIKTFKNKKWVCDGYARLFLYMASYAWIENVQIKYGMAFTTEFFPEFWHAWIQIGDAYYDPTFDDPYTLIGNVGNKKNTTWSYYKLPKDLMYIDRYDENEVPEYIKKLSLQERKMLALKNKYEKYPLYKDHPFMAEVRVRKTLGIDENTVLTPDNLSSYLPTYEVKQNILYDKNTKKRIRYIEYYKVTEENIDDIIHAIGQKNIPPQNLIYLKWYKDSNQYEYRIATQIQFFGL